MKIAEMMRVNRHTISRDIEFGYEELSEQWNGSIVSMILKQIHRLEIQRTRLLKQLENQNGFHERMMLERMIFEIDSKIAHMIAKVATTQENVIKLVIEMVDKIRNDSNKKSCWINNEAFYKVSRKTRTKIMELIKEDHKNPENYLEEYKEM